MNPIGILLIAASVVLPAVAIWPMAQTYPNGALFAQYLGIVSILLMGWAQIIATRWRSIELVFGAMDRAYVIHKWLGIGALVTMYLHDTIDPEIKKLAAETWLTNLGEEMGEISLNGITILVAFTMALFIPYHLWRWTHRFIGIFFVLAVLHFAFIAKPMANTSPVGLFVLGMGLLGTIATIYASLPLRFQRKHAYTVTDIAQTGGATAITLTPANTPMRHRAGQFAFFEFNKRGLTEPHPFTISSAPNTDGTLRITAKALGNFTRKLPQKLDIGAPVNVQGPFGRFGTARARKSQIWIGGGIGITPFTALLETWDETKPHVDLFYCFRGTDNAPHLDTLIAQAAVLPNVEIHPIDSNTDGRLTPEKIISTCGADLSKHALLYCGPKQMRDNLRNSLSEYGLSKRRFHYEEFEIRTDIWPISWINANAHNFIPWIKNYLVNARKS
jgi:predicted ferric reductase